LLKKSGERTSEVQDRSLPEFPVGQMSDLQELMNLFVSDISGAQFKLGDVFSKDIMVVGLLRHFGCLLCRKAAHGLSALLPELEKYNVGLVAIGSGTAPMAKNFQAEFNFKGTLYVDPKREVYSALGCNRGLKYVLSQKTLGSIMSANGEGFSQGKTQGDSLQLGGVFLISKTEGLLFQHLEEYAGHYVDPAVLMECVKSKTVSKA